MGKRFDASYFNKQRNTLLWETPKAITTSHLLETLNDTRGNDLGHSKNVIDKWTIRSVTF